MKILVFCGTGVIAPVIAREMADAMRALGADVLHVQHEGEGPFRVNDHIEEFKPDFLFSLDYMISRLYPRRFARTGVPHATWYVDDPLYIGTKGTNEGDIFFVMDETWSENLKKLGAKHVYYLPICTNPDIFKPSLHPGNDLSHNVSFLGSSRLKEKFDDALKELNTGTALEAIFRNLAKLCMEQPGRPFRDILNEYHPDLNDFFLLDSAYYFKILLKDYASSLVRTQYMKDLPFDTHVYGDETWADHTGGNLTYHRRLDNTTEAPFLYSGSRVSLNFHSGQLRTGINQRVFDVAAAGGFVLTDYRIDLEKLFDFNSEIACFGSKPEMIEKISYYLEHEEERNSISQKARERVLAEHTYKHRAETVLNKLVELHG